MNIEKTNFVIFHPPQRKIPSLNLKISGTLVEQKNCVKYLGLIIDCHLNWKKHVHEVSKKISRGIGILSKLRHFVIDDILTQLYYSLVYPFLTYGLVVWGNTYATTLKPIVTLQKQALRIITFSKRDAQSNPIFSWIWLLCKLPFLCFSITIICYLRPLTITTLHSYHLNITIILD